MWPLMMNGGLSQMEVNQEVANTVNKYRVISTNSIAAAALGISTPNSLGKTIRQTELVME